MNIIWGRWTGFAVGLTNLKQAAGLRALDLIYKRVSMGGGEGDAVVPERSQRGPGSGTWPVVRIPDSDSHVAVTHNLRQVGVEVRRTIVALSNGVSP